MVVRSINSSHKEVRHLVCLHVSFRDGFKFGGWHSFQKSYFYQLKRICIRQYGRISPAEYRKIKRIPCVSDESLQISLTDATDGIDIRYIPVI